MKSLKAFSLMAGLTATVAVVLYLVQAHVHFRELPWALGITLVVLATHMANMAIYFRVAGDKPYRWFA